MKKSFTFLEVLISVIIVFIAGFAFLQLSSQTKYLLTLYQDTKLKVLYSSVGLNSLKGKNFYEALIGFKIDNDKIISELKKHKLNIKVKKTNGLIEVVSVNGINYYNVKVRP